VIGNCGFGFAPVKPEMRERAMLTMTRTEAIPYPSMKAGMPWDWVTYPEFLDSIERGRKGVNMLPFMPIRAVDDLGNGTRGCEVGTQADRSRNPRNVPPAQRRR